MSPTFKQVLASRHALGILTVALFLGGAASLPMSLVEHAWFWRTAIPQCEFACIAQYLFTRPAVAMVLFASGAMFGWTAGCLVGSGRRLIAAVVGGGVLYGSAYAAAVATDWLGMRMDTLLFEFVFRGHYPEWLVVALTFGLASALVGGVVTLTVGCVVHARGLVSRSIVVAAAVALAYVSLAAGLNVVPGWTIGLPERINNHAMPKVTFISDLVVGSAGASLALVMLARGRNPNVSDAGGAWPHE